MDASSKNRYLIEALQLLASKCPRLVKRCYWAGTSAMALEELGHRESFDLDFHTRAALEDTRPLLSEMQDVFGEDFQVIQPPDGFGGGFEGLLRLPSGERVTIEVLSNC